VNLGLTSAGTVAEDAGAGPYANSLADVEYMFARSGAGGRALARVRRSGAAA
jgi:hypothetical protein